MAILRINDFGGIIPRLDDKSLPPNCAVSAVNCDLQGGNIKPLYDILNSISTIGSAATADAAAQYGYCVTQVPSSVIKVSAGGSNPGATGFYPTVPNLWVTGANYQIGDMVRNIVVEYRCVRAHTSGVFATDLAAGYWVQSSYDVIAGDELWYAVYLPSGSSTAGQGCIDIEFTDGRTLGTIVDQNSVNAKTGNIGSYAAGKWYLRKIPLAGQLDSSGFAITGKTIRSLWLWQNLSSSSEKLAYYAFAVVYNAGNIRAALLSADMAIDDWTQVNSYSGYVGAHLLDEDEVVTQEYPLIFPQLPGFPRMKSLACKGPNGMNLSSSNNILSKAAHDAIIEAAGSSSGRYFNYNATASPHKTQANTSTPSAAYGWIGVQKPQYLAPMPTPVPSGGTGTTVSRSYCYTVVSEDGLESAPSQAASASGKDDGTWTITGIPTWSGTDKFHCTTAGSMFHKRRIYRTTGGGSTFKFLAELDDNDTSLVDTSLDASLGEDLPTTAYRDTPPCSFYAQFVNGMLAGIVNGCDVAFCEPYQYHAWPLAYRYTMPMSVSNIALVADRLIAIGSDRPIVLSGTAPESVLWTQYPVGEACISYRAAVSSRWGFVYPGSTGWNVIDSGGPQQVTASFLTPDQYAALVSKETIAFCDDKKLYWFTRGLSSGYSFEFGAQEKSLTTIDLTAYVYGLGFYAPRNSRWVSYWESSAIKIGKLFSNTSQRLKWTWKSKLLRTSKQVRMKVAQVDSSEWGSLSASMKARENAYKTGGGGSPYTITITGLTQAELWCYLKIWAEADKGSDAVLVYDDFVVSDRPVRLARSIKSDCWQFELRGNIAVSSITIAELERELNQE